MVLTDEALMQAYQSGDSLSFETLYLRSSPKLYGYLRKKLGSSAEVDDVFQQVFLKLHRTRLEYDPQYRFEQWLFVIARTTVLDHFRKMQRAQAIMSDHDVTAVPEPMDTDTQPELDMQIPSLSGLTAEQRVVVELKVLEELAYSEIAKRLKRSEESVRQQFSRAVGKLRADQKTDIDVKRGTKL